MIAALGNEREFGTSPMALSYEVTALSRGGGRGRMTKARPSASAAVVAKVLSTASEGFGTARRR
jgi:hypothetical protein